MSDILEIQHLKKSFGTQQVLKGIDLHVPQHSIYGFIGQNGAGKTTTMKMILGLLKSDEGSIYVCGEKVSFGETKTNAYIGYLSDVPEYYGFMNATEYMKLCADISHMETTVSKLRIQELLKMVGLDAYKKKKLKGYSRGMKQRLGIAQALLNEPKLLICDEPTSALDPIGRKEILDILLQVKEKTTIILSTHILSDVERICDHIAILKDGVIALHGELNALRQAYGKNTFMIHFQKIDDLQRMYKILSTIHDQIHIEENQMIIQSDTPEVLEKQLMEKLLEQNIMPLNFAWQQPSLEHVFMEVVQ